MNKMGSIEENSPADISLATPLTSQACVSISSASPTSPDHQNTKQTDFKVPAVQDFRYSHALNQKEPVPTENAVGSEPRVENIVSWSSETRDTLLPSSLDNPEAHLSDVLHHPVNENSINITDFCVDGVFPSDASTAMNIDTDKLLIVPSNEPSKLQLEIASSHALNQKELVSTENAVGSEPRVGNIVSWSSETRDTLLPSSLNIPEAHLTDVLHHPLNGNSINIPDFCFDGVFPSDASTAMNIDTDKLLIVPSNEPSKLQLDIASIVNKTPALIDRSKHEEHANVHKGFVETAAPSKLQLDIASMVNKTPALIDHSKHEEHANVHKGFVETAAPIESVKEAVNKIGGITNWTAYKILAAERRKQVEHELEKAQEEIPQYKKLLEAASDAKAKALTDVDNIKRLVEEQRLNLERAQTEEAHAKLDYDFARLQIAEMEQGIAYETSAAAKTQVEFAKAKQAAAVADLKSVKQELEALQGKYVSLVNDRNMAVMRAEKAVSASTEIEKVVEELTLELIAAKGTLESAHVAHLEAEEQRIASAMARKQDSLNWKKELKQAEDEVQKLNKQVSSENDLKSKLGAASALLLNLKTELATCVESRSTQNIDSVNNEENPKGEREQVVTTLTETQAEAISARREAEEAKVSIEKAKDDVNCLRVSVATFKLKLEKEKTAHVAMRQREGMASAAVASIKSELNGTLSKVELVQKKEKGVEEMMVDLSTVLQQATQEADQAKLEATLAHEELRKAKEEVEQAKAGMSATESRLHAAVKEIEATKASERLALEAVKALQECELTASTGAKVTPTGVTLSLEEYNALSRSAHEVEGQSYLRVEAAISQIEVAKDSELRILEKLEEANRELGVKKEELRIALERAERAKEGKLCVEQEMRKWRIDSERRRKSTFAASEIINPVRSPPRGSEEGKELNNFGKDHAYFTRSVSSPTVLMPENDAVASELKTNKKKKRDFFPRILLFMNQKKKQLMK